MNRRFRLFLFGFIIGIIVVILVYGEKSSTMFDWTPEGRVLKRLKLTEKVISDSMQCVMDCNNFGEKEWKRLLKDGDVNFAQAREKPYAIYTVQLKNDQKEMIHQLSFLAKDSISVIIDFKGLRKECQCE